MNTFIEGSICGFLNGFFGSGGGIAAVPILEHEGCNENQAHATSVALIFIFSIITAVAYGISGSLDFSSAWEFIPYGLAGAITGSLFLKKIKANILRKIFGGLIIVSAIRMLL